MTDSDIDEDNYIKYGTPLDPYEEGKQARHSINN